MLKLLALTFALVACGHADTESDDLVQTADTAFVSDSTLKLMYNRRSGIDYCEAMCLWDDECAAFQIDDDESDCTLYRTGYSTETSSGKSVYTWSSKPTTWSSKTTQQSDYDAAKCMTTDEYGNGVNRKNSGGMAVDYYITYDEDDGAERCMRACLLNTDCKGFIFMDDVSTAHCRTYEWHSTSHLSYIVDRDHYCMVKRDYYGTITTKTDTKLQNGGRLYIHADEDMDQTWCDKMCLIDDECTGYNMYEDPNNSDRTVCETWNSAATTTDSTGYTAYVYGTNDDGTSAKTSVDWEEEETQALIDAAACADTDNPPAFLKIRKLHTSATETDYDTNGSTYMCKAVCVLTPGCVGFIRSDTSCRILSDWGNEPDWDLASDYGDEYCLLIEDSTIDGAPTFQDRIVNMLMTQPSCHYAPVIRDDEDPREACDLFAEPIENGTNYNAFYPNAEEKWFMLTLNSFRMWPDDTNASPYGGLTFDCSDDGEDVCGVQTTPIIWWPDANEFIRYKAWKVENDGFFAHFDESDVDGLSSPGDRGDLFDHTGYLGADEVNFGSLGSIATGKWFWQNNAGAVGFEDASGRDTWTHQWTKFGGSLDLARSPVVMATHFHGQYKAQDRSAYAAAHPDENTVFSAIWWSTTEEVSEAYVVYNGQANAMTKTFGTTDLEGRFDFYTATPTQCQPYFFLFKKSDDTIVRMPEQDDLYYGTMWVRTNNWDPSDGGSATATVTIGDDEVELPVYCNENHYQVRSDGTFANGVYEESKWGFDTDGGCVGCDAVDAIADITTV